MRFVFLLLFSSQILALTAHKITYSFALNGWEIATETRELSQQTPQQAYIYTRKARTTGLAKLIKDYQIDATTNFVINNNGVDAQHYYLLEKDGKKTKKDIRLRIDSKAQLVKSSTQIWRSKKGNIVDSLSIFLALTNDFKANPEQTQFSYQVTDGKRIKYRHYQTISTETIVIQNKPLQTIKLSDGKGLVAWLAPFYDYLPVRIEKNDDGSQYKYLLTDITINKPI